MQGAVIILLGFQISKMQKMADRKRILNAKLTGLDPVVLEWDPTVLMRFFATDLDACSYSDINAL